MSFYLHMLDKVQGTAHFFVSTEEANKISLDEEMNDITV